MRIETGSTSRYVKRDSTAESGRRASAGQAHRGAHSGPSRLVASRTWIQAHPLRCMCAVVITASCAEEASRSSAVWITKALPISAGLLASSAALPATMRCITLPFVKANATLCGGLLTLAASSLSTPTPSNVSEIKPCLLGFLVAGGALLVAQLLNQLEADTRERGLENFRGSRRRAHRRCTTWLAPRAQRDSVCCAGRESVCMTTKHRVVEPS